LGRHERVATTTKYQLEVFLMKGNGNKRKVRTILLSVLVVALVGAIVGVGVYFYFSDKETSEGNKITAGTLDLTYQITAHSVNDPDGNSAAVELSSTDAQNGASAYVTFTDIAPSDTGTIEWTAKNIGSLHGYLTVTATQESDTGDTNEPEQVAIDENGGDENLDEYLKVTLTQKIGAEEPVTLADGVLLKELKNTLEGKEEAKDQLLKAAGAENDEDTCVYTLSWELPEDTGNIVQGDTSTLTLTFQLNQVKNQGNP